VSFPSIHPLTDCGGISHRNAETSGKDARHRSGEIDVISDTTLAGALQQPKQGHSLLATGSAANDYHDAMMRLRCCEMQKVVPVAGQEYAIGPVGKADNGLV
jgi:hypothetical protein